MYDQKSINFVYIQQFILLHIPNHLSTKILLTLSLVQYFLLYTRPWMQAEDHFTHICQQLCEQPDFDMLCGLIKERNKKMIIRKRIIIYIYITDIQLPTIQTHLDRKRHSLRRGNKKTTRETECQCNKYFHIRKQQKGGKERVELTTS